MSVSAIQTTVSREIGKSTYLTRRATELVVREWSPQTCRALASPIVGVSARRAAERAEKRRIYYAVKEKMSTEPVGFVEWLFLLPMLWKIVVFLWEWFHRDKTNQDAMTVARASMGIVE